MTAVKHEDYDDFVVIHSYIAKRYLQSWFLLDLISSFPFDAAIRSAFVNFAGASLFQFTRLLRLLKLFRVFRLVNLIKTLEYRFGINGAVLKFITMIFIISLACHLIACCWWYICFNMSRDSSWIDNSGEVDYTNLRNAPLIEQYVTSLYWTYMTLLGVGYGDIVPATTAERLLNSVIMLGGTTLILNLLLSSVSDMVIHMFSARGDHQVLVASTKAYLDSKRVPRKLTHSIIKFLEVRNNVKVIQNEKALVSVLPTRLKEEIIFQQNLKILKYIPIFNYIQNRSFIVYIYDMLTVTYFDKYEYIFHEGSLQLFINWCKANIQEILPLILSFSSQERSNCFAGRNSVLPKRMLRVKLQLSTTAVGGVLLCPAAD